MTLALCAALLVTSPEAASAPASRPIDEKTRPELFRDVPPDRPDATEPGSTAPPNESSISFWAGFLMRTVLVLGIIVMLAYLVLNKGLGRLMRAQGAMQASRMVKLVERLPLGTKNAVYLVEIEGRRLLIGTAEQATTLIADVSSQSSGASVADVLAKENAR